MSIGIVTYYNAINEGAFLQAYCLKNFIESCSTSKVYFVPNKSVDIFSAQKKQLLQTKNPRLFWVNLNRIIANREAQKAYLPVETIEKKYDTVVVGSDEMWNEKNKAFNKYNTAASVNAGTRISYAVSMGNFDEALSLDSIKEISKFIAISVRDLNSKKILEAAGFTNVSVHLDPVFLYQIPSQLPKIRKSFIMIYGSISNETTVRKVKEYAHRNGFVTLSVDIYNKWCDVNIAAKSPFQFVGYIDKANLIITNMFHGTMLSVVRNKSFISIQTERRKKKIEYASRKLMFTERCVDEQFDWNIENVLKNKLDYQTINSVIEQEKGLVREYFARILLNKRE